MIHGEVYYGKERYCFGSIYKWCDDGTIGQLFLKFNVALESGGQDGKRCIAVCGFADDHQHLVQRESLRHENCVEPSEMRDSEWSRKDDHGDPDHRGNPAPDTSTVRW